ncbi:hypothetical protein MOVS_10795 (plasmid) [Moraxella ovis]|uniref:Conjugal transfer mating pair stabilization protein TraN n=1 Tax=Moraxella ovis TaxID=29433 RepID=A0A378QCZ7_9GAMM|nr:conjugal transfer protein TraN [Moraxella ovis]ANB92574.1 hypothetical protein MOVS_10795 [Moraxella ovis]STY98581.1 conjugal transfer mating pair stabilization protein TraN [Moraxella ovis]
MKKLVMTAIAAIVFGSQAAQANDCQGAMTATINSMDDAIRYGKAVGDNCKGLTQSSVSANNAAAVAQSIDANYSNHTSTQYYDRDLNVSLRAGNSKIAKCSGDISALSDRDKADCEAVEFAAKNGEQRPKYNLDYENDPLIDSSKDQINNAKIEDGQNFCRVVRNVVPATYEQKQCLVTSGTHEASCQDTVNLSGCIVPTAQYRVADGGVVKGSTRVQRASELPTNIEFGDKALQLTMMGHGRRRLGPHVAEYAFEIKNLNQIDRAVIARYYRDDGLRVWVNDTLVIDDGYGIQAVSTVHPNKDLKPFLKEGINIIKADLFNNTRDAILHLTVDIPVFKGCEKTFNTTCTTAHQNPNVCQLVKKTCVEPSQEPLAGILGSVDREPLGSCKKQTYEMVCAGELNVSECSSLDTQGCEQISSECTERDGSGKCVTYNQTYQCKKTEERVTETRQCEQQLCNGDNCIGNPPPEADGDFGKAIAIMEAQRQAGTYGKTPTGYNIFDGDPSVCSVKVLAGHSVMSCCKAISTGDKFQNRTQGIGATQTYGNNPNQPAIDDRGSKYVYDNVFDQNKTVAVIQSAATLGWLQCNNEEKVLAIKRGSGLCEYSHEWCSKKTFFGSCLEKKRQYCCYRSTLARIINKQGRQQLGKGAGCNGFTLDELQRLDFSRMDLSEFINEIVPADIDVEQRKRQVQQTVKKSFNSGVNYYDR